MPKGNAKETEQRVYAEAIRLFNEQGYDNVSLRDIAKAAGTTIGNMTYHFSKKEDLLMRILEDLYEGFQDEQTLDREIDPLKAFLVSLVSAQENRRAYPFYYRHMNQIVGSSEALMMKSQAFQTQLFQGYCACFRKLVEAGFIKRDIDDQALSFLSLLVISIEVSWAQPASPACNEALPSMSMAQAAISALAPYLSDQGVSALERLRGDLGV